MMHSENNYAIKPNPNLTLDRGYTPTVSGQIYINIATYTTIGIVVILLIKGLISSCGEIILAGAGTAGTLAFFFYLHWNHRTEKAISRYLRIQRDQEAKRSTEQALTIYERSHENLNSLAGYLEGTATALRIAEREFHERAYGPFWDKVESAARNLAAFERTVNLLQQENIKYMEVLHNRDHTFPLFTARLENLPNPAPALRELRRVVRMGQTDFEFANIWEHRRTREAINLGFSSLGEAISRIGYQIMSSVETLDTSFSVGMGNVVGEARGVRREIEESSRGERKLLEDIRSAISD